MIEDKHNADFDFLMRSILENGREEVPDHIWDAVSDGLDTIARRKRLALLWRRTAVSCSIAAALAAGLFFAFREVTIPDNGEGMVAVVGGGDTEQSGIMETCILTARQTEPESLPDNAAPQAETVAVAGSASDFIKQIQVNTTAADDASAKDTGNTSRPVSDNIGSGMRQDWPEDEDKADGKHIQASFVLSGITGTNSTRSLAKQNLMKSPTVPSSVPKTGITETSTNTTYGIPVSFGMGVKIDFTKRWSLGTGLNYTLLSRKFYGNYTKATPEGEVEFSQSSDIRNTQHYVGIPLTVFFNIVSNKYVNFYAYSGGTVEKCISDRYEILSATGSRLTHKEAVKGVQLSANIGIGAEFMIGEHLGIYVDPSLRYYFDNGQPKSIRTAQPLMLGFEMGIRARL